MKLFFSLLITFIAFAFLAQVDSVSAIEGGCFQRKDLKLETSVSDHPACLQVFAMAGCLNNIELYIRNDCDEAFTYEMNGGTYEIYKHEDWLRESRAGNASAVTDVNDRTVSQEFGKWSKEIKYKDDPSKIITVDVTVKSKQNLFLNDEKSWLVAIISAGVVTVGSILMLGWMVMNKRGKSGGRRK